MKASYQLVSITQKSHIDPGEVAEIELYLTGYGDIQRNKLHILYSVSDLLSAEDPGSVHFPIAGVLDESGEMLGISSGKFVGEKKLGDTGTMVHLPSAYFYEPSRNRETEALPDIASEGSHGGIAPVNVRINTDTEARPGDYNFTFTLSYEDSDGNIEQSQQVATVHINGVIERNKPELKIAGLFLTILSLISTIAFYFV